jgi:hypothetical protein
VTCLSQVSIRIRGRVECTAGMKGVVRRASGILVGSQPISPFLCISLDRRARESNGIQGAVSKSENWHWLGREGGSPRLIYYFGGRATSQVICSDMKRQLIIAP